jgi:aminoglycoside 6'-N-acetyltransferase
MVSYAFGAMTTTDLPRMLVAALHVAEWWGDPREQFALASEDFLASKGLSHPPMQQFVVELDNRPFAYIQCYDPAAWPNHGFGTVPQGARGIDQFIGKPEMINCDHGSAFIRAFVDGLLRSGAPRVVTDPSPANTRAVKAYENAGFQQERRVSTPDGSALLRVREL